MVIFNSYLTNYQRVSPKEIVSICHLKHPEILPTSAWWSVVVCELGFRFQLQGDLLWNIFNLVKEHNNYMIYTIIHTASIVFKRILRYTKVPRLNISVLA